ncbi:hypothetical protein BABINDRAFT_163635 [Babjeviella inositovora NRRL Y-12698]|uniref:C2H2-type domain-containing protein n=1 Tax=Babjeviella inositovora NRRL Y-12698 TaxID=984486 RepID=A0A1E3QI67_9ASCO|nr:uncharacterized protein BABINDRAFT_163635 [Babjeviella inositovora NRRL Y-12698]ODQ77389.1 hypothetical protein BABINDRAFT_163635 [Babjeviella inositovora NRRL Y-12698]
MNEDRDNGIASPQATYSHQSTMNNYFQNIPNIDVQNVVNAVNSALAVDLDSLNNHHDEYHVAIDPTIGETSGNYGYTELHSLPKIAKIAPSENAEPHLKGETVMGLTRDLPPGVDPKKMCPFCGRTFSHPGSLGRHMDLKKGTRLHPADEIERLRGNVKRRGDKVEIQNRRRLRTKEYNSRQDVRERNRVRRRLKDRSNRARNISQKIFLNRLGNPTFSINPTFARFVVYFLPPSQWPPELPNLDTFKHLTNLLSPTGHGSAATAKTATGSNNNDLLTEYFHKLNYAYESWSALAHAEQQTTWTKEIRASMEDTLGGLSLFDLASRDIWIEEESKRQETLLYANDNSEDRNDTDPEFERESQLQLKGLSDDEYYPSTSAHDEASAVALAAAVAAAVASEENQTIAMQGLAYLGEKSMDDIINVNGE